MSVPPLLTHPDGDGGGTSTRTSILTPETSDPRHALTEPDPHAEAEQARQAGLGAAARMADRAPTLREVRSIALRISAGVGVLVLAVAVILALLAGNDTAQVAASVEANRAAAEASDAQTARRFDDALRAADEANVRLAAQGLPQVPIDRSNPAAAVLGAATANVLGSLTAAQRGSPEPIARAIGDVVRAGPAVQMTDVAGEVSRYLAANPAARGERGEPGTPGTNGTNGTDGQNGERGPAGPAPTQAEIEQAFRSAVANDPQLLCAGQGGEFRLVQGIRLDDGRTLDAYLCAGEFGQGEPDPPPETVTATPDPPATSSPSTPDPGDSATPSPSPTFEDGSPPINGG